MNGKMIIGLAITLLAISCMVPMTSEDADAATSDRVSYVYVYYGECTIPDLSTYVYEYDAFWNYQLYFIEGSDNDKLMDRYLDGQDVDIKVDDRERIWDIGHQGASNQKIKVYEWSKYSPSSTVWWINENMKATVAMEPYGSLSFFVKSGNTLEFTVVSCVNNEGDELRVGWEDENWRTHYADPTLEIECEKSGVYVLEIEGSELYCDIIYNVEGNSEPNGSATMFIVICAAVTVLVLAILIIAAQKPKWSK